MGEYNYLINKFVKFYIQVVVTEYIYIYNYRFKSSRNGLIFCTDVAARGIDVKDIKYVIHYELPKTFEVSCSWYNIFLYSI